MSRDGCCASCSSERPREGERNVSESSGWDGVGWDGMGGEGESLGSLAGTSRIITTWCLSLLTWWRSNRSWRWRSMMTWSSSPATFSFCLTTQKHTTRLKKINTNNNNNNNTWKVSVHPHERASPVFAQPDSPEYRAACKLWDLYLRTKNEFVQRGEFDEDDEDGYNLHDNPGGCTEDEVNRQMKNVGSINRNKS